MTDLFFNVVFSIVLYKLAERFFQAAAFIKFSGSVLISTKGNQLAAVAVSSLDDVFKHNCQCQSTATE